MIEIKFGHLGEIASSNEGSAEERKCPTLAEIKALRAAKEIAKSIEDFGVNVTLCRVQYDDEPDCIYTTELRIDVALPLEIERSIWIEILE